MIHIYLPYYQDKNPDREYEIETCIYKNLALCPYKLTLLYHETDIMDYVPAKTKPYGFGSLPYLWQRLFPKLYEGEKVRAEFPTIIQGIKLTNTENRVSFNDVFNQIKIDSQNATETDLFILCNSDIYLHNLEQFESYFKLLDDKNNSGELKTQNPIRYAMALSRWDRIGKTETLFDRSDSQDTWVFRGKTDIELTLNINFGLAGCDNRLANELTNLGYVVINPSKTIKTVHYHESNIRNYIDEKGQVINRIPPPYTLIQPTY